MKGTAIEEIRKLAAEYREATAQNRDVAPIELKSNILAHRLKGESFNSYLQFACPVDLTSKNPEKCTTYPQNFLWPNSRFFLRHRPQ